MMRKKNSMDYSPSAGEASFKEFKEETQSPDSSMGKVPFAPGIFKFIKEQEADIEEGKSMIDDGSIHKAQKGGSMQSRVIHEVKDESNSLKTESDKFGFDIQKGQEILQDDLERIRQIKAELYRRKGSFEESDSDSGEEDSENSNKLVRINL